MTSIKPEEGGWWDGFLETMMGGADAMGHGTTARAVGSFARGLAGDVKEQIVDPARENPTRFILDQVGPGNLIGGVTARAAKPAVGKLLKALLAEGGATLEPSAKPFAGSGYAVADPDLTAIVSSPKEVKAFLARRDVKNALAAGKKIGKWTDPETGKTEVNITEIIEAEKDALKAAAQRGEQAVGHIQDGAYMGDVRNPHAPVNAVKELLAGMRTADQMKRITEIPSTRGKQLADTYESLPKNDPAAKEAYDALNTEVAKQLEAIQGAGYKIEYVDADPYKSSADMMKDVRENKTLKVFKTPRPAGPGHLGPDGKYTMPQNEAAATRKDPIVAAAVKSPASGKTYQGLIHADAIDALREAEGKHVADALERQDSWNDFFVTKSGELVDRRSLSKEWGGRRPIAEMMKLGEPAPAQKDFHPYMTPEQNDRFRAVHDFLAHAGGGNQFGAVGEENAYRVHASTLSDLAKRALASETRGQNSWVNFGPESHKPVKERPFAEQKAALWPEELLGDYDQMGAAPHSPVPPETLKQSSITLPDGRRFEGANHGEAWMKAEDAGFDGDPSDVIEGYLTSNNRFVDRETGVALAKQNRQIVPSQKADAYDRKMDERTAVNRAFNAPAVHTREQYKPERRGVFDFAPEGGVPATEYREPAPLPFETTPRPRAEVPELAEQIATDPRVEKRIASDVEKGLDLGGRGWYGLLPLRRYFEARQGPISFADFNQAGAAGSARTPTHNELTNASILLYAKRHGITPEQARQVYLKEHKGTMKPTFMGMHGKIFERAQQQGYAGPARATDGALKIPNYYHDRMLGASGVPLDTHELRMLSQALGIPEEQVKAMMSQGGETYNMMTQPYRRVAKRYGLTEDQVQASRWIGGGKETGLKSQPTGDFMQTLEDGLLWTARSKGLDESPRGLRSLWDRIAQGEDFFMPYGGEGGFPVR
jgi:hypothetical protein